MTAGDCGPARSRTRRVEPDEQSLLFPELFRYRPGPAYLGQGVREVRESALALADEMVRVRCSCGFGPTLSHTPPESSDEPLDQFGAATLVTESANERVRSFLLR